MRPLTVVTGVLLGTSASIFAGLAVVGFLFALLVSDAPRLEAEIGPLIRSTALFFGLTAICAVSFVGQLRKTGWRWAAQAVMWAGVAATAWYYLPG